MRPTKTLFLSLAAFALVTAVVCIAAQSGDSLSTQGAGLIKNEPGAYQGYTLISPLQSKSTFLIDMAGKVVKQWDSDATPSSLAYLLDNGNLLRADVQPNPPFGNFAGIGGHFHEVDWTGNAVWEFTYGTATSAQHHDFMRMPNGNLMLLMKDRKNAAEAIAAGRIPSTLPQGTNVEPDSLIEIKPTGKTTGEVVWEWHLWDHLIQDSDENQANFGDVAAHPELLDVNYNITAGQRGNPDWSHGNGLSYNADFDQIIISSRNFGEFWIIDHSTTTKEAATHAGGRGGKGGDFLYRWGNPKTYRAGTAEDQRLWGQHNVHWIPKGLPGAGHLLIFNNGDTRPVTRYSSADEILLPADANGRYPLAPGKAYGPEKATWSFSAPPDFYSVNISGAMRLPNGNTLICSGAQGIIFEVTPQNKIVWQYNMPPIAAQPARGAAAAPAGQAGRGGRGNANAQVFRAYRFGADSPALKGKSLVAGKSLEEAVK